MRKTLITIHLLGLPGLVFASESEHAEILNSVRNWNNPNSELTDALNNARRPPSNTPGGGFSNLRSHPDLEIPEVIWTMEDSEVNVSGDSAVVTFTRVVRVATEGQKPAKAAKIKMAVTLGREGDVWSVKSHEAQPIK